MYVPGINKAARLWLDAEQCGHVYQLFRHQTGLFLMAVYSQYINRQKKPPCHAGNGREAKRCIISNTASSYSTRRRADHLKLGSFAPEPV